MRPLLRFREDKDEKKWNNIPDQNKISEKKLFRIV